MIIALIISIIIAVYCRWMIPFIVLGFVFLFFASQGGSSDFASNFLTTLGVLCIAITIALIVVFVRRRP